MAYNITLLDNVTDVGKAMSFLNVNSSGLFFTFLILGAAIIIAMIAIRNNINQIRALFYGFSITFVPMVFLRGIVNFGSGLIPDWYIAIHIVILAVTGVLAYFQKN